MSELNVYQRKQAVMRALGDGIPKNGYNPHHKYKYAVGHRAHTLMTVNGIPLVSHIATARDSDQDYLVPNLQTVRQRFPMLSIGAVIVDAGYDSDEHHDFLYQQYGIIPVIVKDNLAYPSGYSEDGCPLCPLGYATRRKGIEYNHQRTKFACHKICAQDEQKKCYVSPHLRQIDAKSVPPA